MANYIKENWYTFYIRTTWIACLCLAFALVAGTVLL